MGKYNFFLLIKRYLHHWSLESNQDSQYKFLAACEIADKYSESLSWDLTDP